MTANSSWHGNPMYFDEATYLWYYTEDDCPVKDDPLRLCKHCGIESTVEGHDGCLGTLPGVTNACCGHGENKYAYIQFADERKTIRGNDAIEYITKVNNERIHGKTQINEILAIKKE